jgi:hypothetical protein
MLFFKKVRIVLILGSHSLVRYREEMVSSVCHNIQLFIR